MKRSPSGLLPAPALGRSARSTGPLGQGRAWFWALLFGSACVPAFEEDAGLRYKDAQGSGDDAAVFADASDPGEPDATPADLGPPDTGVPEVDTDGDGLPDAVDPAPTRRNPLIFSDGFDDTNQGWIFSSVTMAIHPERSLLQVEDVEPFEREGWIGPRPSWSTYYVRSRIRLGAVGSANDNLSGHAGLIVLVNQVTPSRYLTCGIDKTNRRAVLAEHEGNQRRTLAEATVTGVLEDWTRLDFLTQNGNHECWVGDVHLVGNSGTFISGAIGFRSYDATFDADYIQVYELN